MKGITWGFEELLTMSSERGPSVRGLDEGEIYLSIYLSIFVVGGGRGMYTFTHKYVCMNGCKSFNILGKAMQRPKRKRERHIDRKREREIGQESCNMPMHL